MKSSYIFMYSVLEKLSLRNCNYFLHIGRRKNHFQPKSQKYVLKPVIKSKEKELLHAQLLDSLQKCNTVQEQIKVFCSLVKLPDKDVNYRYSICQDLKRILQPYYPSCSVHLIGSSANGFGFKGCDVDLSIQFSNGDVQLPVEKGFNEAKEIKNPANKVNPSKHQLMKMKNILQTSKYGELLTVIPGRCPILNFTTQNLPCDLSVNNSSAFNSTKLMLLCGKLDERVAPLMQIIVYWAKQSRLLGGPSRFKTYAIFLMVIYFLQTRNPPVLPSVETIFAKTEFLDNLENWSYDVQKYLNQFEKNKNNQTIEQLLREFFLFYGNFDFSHVICPINSSSIDRKSFASKFDCSNKFELNTLSIQDPLELEWNVTTGVNWKYCKKFLKTIIPVWEKCQDQNSWIPGPHHWGLAFLINDECSYQKFDSMKELSIDVHLALKVDSFMQENIIDLCEEAARNVKYILSYCLQFECYTFGPSTNFSILEYPPSVKTAIENFIFKNDSMSNLSPLKNCKNSKDPYLIAQYICATEDTWSGRNTYIPLPNSVENVFETEHKLSKKIALERQANEKEIFYFLCECYGVYLEKSICLHLQLKSLNRDKFIPKLGVFLKEYIPNFMNKVSYESLNKNGERLR